MNDLKYAHILEFIDTKTAFTVADFRPSFLQRRVSKRIGFSQCKNEYEYLELLKKDDEELIALIDELTIQVSWFYRNPLNWELLQTRVFAEILTQKAKQNDKLFRIWCAGCAGGEEAYTIAILLQELIEKEKLSTTIQIFATDIDRRTLDRAKRGLYNSESLKLLPHGLVEKYFTLVNEQFQISPIVKDLVHFSYFDLLDNKHLAPSESVYADFDITLCRNVLIYYQEGIQEQIFTRLSTVTATMGFIMTGESEVPIGAEKNRVRKIASVGNIYQKI